jgi:hypothetical protein
MHVGEEITQIFSPYIRKAPLYQNADEVVGVSSFWGGSTFYSPLQTLGPQDCFIYGDCLYSWSPLTINGEGGRVTGSGNGLSFNSSPTELFDLYGYTEFIEFTFNQSVYLTELLIGMNTICFLQIGI